MTIRDDNSPAQDATAVTPGATALAKPAKAIYVGATGNVTVTTIAGTSVTFSSVPAGTIIPLSCTHVTAAAAGGIVALHEV